MVINDISSFNALVDKINSFKRFYIYGASVYGVYLFRSIKDFCADKLESFVVTKLRTERYSNPSSLFGYKVKEISDIEISDDDLFIIAVDEKNHIAIRNTLEEHGAKNIICITHNIFKIIAKQIIDSSPLYSGLFSGNDFTVDGVTVSDPSKLNTSVFTLLLQIDDLFMYDKISNPEFELITEGPYEIDEVKIDEDDVIFDIGAHVGIFSCIGAAKGKTVYAFEPCSELIPEIKKQSALYDNRIIPVETALSDHVGTASYKIADSQGMLVSQINDDDNTESVNVTTIDEFVRTNNIEKVDFIKADIEGAERNMLRGAAETLKKYAPKLAICTYHLPDDKEVLENIVKEANPNYNIIHRYKKMYCWVD